jgi:hypothetical protein
MYEATKHISLRRVGNVKRTLKKNNNTEHNNENERRIHDEEDDDEEDEVWYDCSCLEVTP